MCVVTQVMCMTYIEEGYHGVGEERLLEKRP